MDTKGNIKDVYSLTPMQEGMLFHALHDPHSLAYHEISSFRVEGNIDVSAMKASLEKLVERHDILRTIFVYTNLEKPRQVVLKQRTAHFTFHDIRSYSDQDAREQFIEDYKKKDKASKYQLDKDMLLRMAIIQCGDNEYEIFWSHHHIIMDGWCSGILISELFDIYYGIKSNKNASLPEVTPFSNYIKWIERQDKEASLTFWKNYLKDYDTPAFLPRPINQVKQKGFSQKELELKINYRDTEALHKIAGTHEVTLFTCLKAIWALLLTKVNNVTDCVYGTVVSGRPAEVEGIERMVGLFINTIPSRVTYEKNETFSDLLRQIHDNAIASEKHHYISLAEIQENSLCKNQLFDHILVYENYPIDPTTKLSSDDLQIKRADIYEQANYDLGVVIMPGDELTIKFLYNSNFHDDDSISNLIALLDHVKDKVISNPETKLSDITLLSQNEADFLTKEFNTNQHPIPDDITLVNVFEDAVRQMPEQIAIIDKSGHYSYRDLDERSNAVANYLAGLGIGAEDNVGVMMEQHVDMAAAIMGILKSGAAYVPVDPLYPAERISYIMKNADLKTVLTDIPDADGNGIPITHIKGIKPNTKRINKAQSNGRAYIIYTSGTTGNPKGVEVEHKSVVNTLLCRKSEYQFSNRDICLQLFSASFDGFVTAFFTPLLSGSSIVLLENESRRNAETIATQISTYGVTHFIAVPSLLHEIIHKATSEQLSTLRLITLAGEKVSMRLIESCARLNPAMEISQEYGVTEAAVMSTIFRNQQQAHISSIGAPVWNTQIYILDDNRRPAPIGIYGNIYIGGAGVARGYYNNDALTKERFIANPFHQGMRIYNTGDTGRWLPDGTIEYAGRNDGQIKLRGLRLEPAEIEDHMTRIDGIRQALVQKRILQGEDVLCACYVADRKITHHAIREYLMQKLPSYAVPSVYFQVDSMPVTSNGKIDVSKLPVPGADNLSEKVKPRNEAELQLQQTFATVLNVKAEDVGIDTDFFQSGGHSLKAVGLFAKIHKHFNVQLPLEVIFRSPTIRLLAEEISNFQKNDFSRIPVAASKAYYDLSAAQKRQYILYEMNKESTGYNMPAAFELQGEIDADSLEDTFIKIIARHGSLRTSFCIIDGKPRQVVHDAISFKIHRYSSTDRSETYRLFNEFVKPFDLSMAPLIRVALIHEAENRYVLFIDMHHIIADGTSVMILVKEFTQLYVGEKLPKLELQYKDFAEWQHGLIKDGIYKRQGEYWKKAFEDEPDILDLPTDFSRPAIKSFAGAQESFVIPHQHKERIVAISRENNTTPFVVMLSVIKALLSRLSGQHDIVVGTSTAGRRHADIESVIGMFINTLPIRTTFSDEYSFIQLLHAVREASINAFENQDFQFEELLDNLALTRDMSRNPLFDIMFVYQNIEAQEFSIPGITISPLRNEVKISKFDITFEVFETPEGFTVNVEYSTSLFTQRSMKRMCEYLTHIVAIICSNPVIRISDVRLESEKMLLSRCMDLNRTEKNIPEGKTIISLFEERARETPEHIALITSSEKISYADLSERATILARALVAKGVKPNTVVAVFGGRSVETIVGILAVLKSGGAYLPVDVNYPAERIRYMLENANVKHVVSDRHTSLIDGMDCFIDVRDFMSYYQYEEGIVDHAGPDDLAYVIYTSGTTGNPKGVKVRNVGVVNTLLCRKAEYGLNGNDVCAQMFSPSFDGFVTSMFTPLVSGASVLLISDDEVRDVHKIVGLLTKNNVSHFISVPVLFNEIVKSISVNQLSNLRSVTLAGDRISMELIQTSVQKLPETEIAQEYGVTEASVMSTMFRNQQRHHKLLIGKPVWNTNIFILDRHHRLQPVGVPGEIYIGGIGVAAGYINNDKLTEEKFIANPFDPSERLYATGDLGRWTDDSNIEFLGRNDYQVKIRGFRIELGEIESKIRVLAGIEDVVVTDKEDLKGNKLLCAYYISNGDTDPDKIRGHLITCLPGFMIPHQIVEVEKFPVTPNGKIDIKALKKRTDHFHESNVYVAPKTDTEKTLVDIWQTVLGQEKIGVKDNYFSLGGDSIKAIQIAAKLKDAGYEVDITRIFQQPTIEEMASYIESCQSETVADSSEGYIPLTPGQYDFIRRNERWKEQFHYKTIHLRERISVEDLENIVDFIYKTREGLRLNFRDDQAFVNKYSQHNFVMIVDDTATTIEDQIAAATNTMRVDEGPLLRTLFIDREATSLIFIVHELLADEWTWKILLEDLNILLYQQKHGVPFKLTPDTSSIREYAALTEKYLTSPDFESKLEYWTQRVFASMTMLESKKTGTGKTATIRLAFDGAFSNQFISGANDTFQTHPLELFLSSLVRACSKMEYLDEYSFEIVSENRNHVIGNNSFGRTSGRFKTTYPITLINNSDDLSIQIKNHRDTIRTISSHALSWCLSQKNADTDHNPSISVSYFDMPGYRIDDCLFTVDEFFKPTFSRQIQIICFADPDQLEIVIHYPEGAYDPELMTLLKDSLRMSMEEVTACCLSKNFVVETPGDLTYKNISVDALNSLESFFEQDN